MRTRTTTSLIALTLLTSACSSGPPAPATAAPGEDVSDDSSSLAAGALPGRRDLVALTDAAWTAACRRVVACNLHG